MNCDRGFSLIELVVVLAIVSLLTVMAVPAYSCYWLRIKRLEARLSLLEASFLMEKYAMTSRQGYLGATLENVGLSGRTERGWYRLGLEMVSCNDYTLVANPTFKDKMCSQLSCDARGKRDYTGEGSYHDCWGG